MADKTDVSRSPQQGSLRQQFATAAKHMHQAHKLCGAISDLEAKLMSKIREEQELIQQFHRLQGSPVNGAALETINEKLREVNRQQEKIRDELDRQKDYRSHLIRTANHRPRRGWVGGRRRQEFVPITVETENGKKISLTVKATDAIETVLNQVRLQTYMKASRTYRLIYNGQSLDKSLPLAKWNVMRGCTLQLISVTRDNLLLTVKACNGFVCTFAARKSDRIKDVKASIRSKKGIEVERQSLLYNKNVMEDSRTLLSYGIECDSILELDFLVERKQQKKECKQEILKCRDETLKLERQKNSMKENRSSQINQSISVSKLIDKLHALSDAENNKLREEENQRGEKERQRVQLEAEVKETDEKLELVDQQMKTLLSCGGKVEVNGSAPSNNIKELGRQKQNLKHLRRRQLQQLQTCKSEISSSENNISRMQKQTQSLSRDLAKQKHSEESIKAKISELENTLRNIDEQCVSYRRDMQILKAALASLSGTYAKYISVNDFKNSHPVQVTDGGEEIESSLGVSSCQYIHPEQAEAVQVPPRQNAYAKLLEGNDVAINSQYPLAKSGVNDFLKNSHPVHITDKREEIESSLGKKKRKRTSFLCWKG